MQKTLINSCLMIINKCQAMHSQQLQTKDFSNWQAMPTLEKFRK
ncbi:hypothetical protein [Anabaena sp. 4-3]|nr:hypothetical protein [Anabaena sp. 4-3]